MVKEVTIRMVLSLAVPRGWHLHQLDVKNVFFAWCSESEGLQEATSWI
jgi:hypothetical protein